MLAALLPLLLAAATPAPDNLIAQCSLNGRAFDLVTSSSGVLIRAAEVSEPLLPLADGAESVLPPLPGSTACDHALAVPLRDGLVLLGLRWEATSGAPASDGAAVYDPAAHRVVEWFRGVGHSPAVDQLGREGYVVILSSEAGQPVPANLRTIKVAGHSVQSVTTGTTQPRVLIRYHAGLLEARVDTAQTWEHAADELRSVFHNEPGFADFIGRNPIVGRFERLTYVRAQLDDGRTCIAASPAAFGDHGGWHCSGDEGPAARRWAHCKAGGREFELDWDPTSGTSLRRSGETAEPLPLHFLGTAWPGSVDPGKHASVCDHTMALGLPDGTVLLTALHPGGADGGRVLSAFVYVPATHRILAQADQLGVEPIVRQVASNTVALAFLPAESEVSVTTDGLELAGEAVRSVELRRLRVGRRLRYVGARLENRDDVDATFEENADLRSVFKKPEELTAFIGYDALSGRAQSTTFFAVTLPGPTFCVAPNTAAALADGDYWRCGTKGKAK